MELLLLYAWIVLEISSSEPLVKDQFNLIQLR